MTDIISNEERYDCLCTIDNLKILKLMREEKLEITNRNVRELDSIVFFSDAMREFEKRYDFFSFHTCIQYKDSDDHTRTSDFAFFFNINNDDVMDLVYREFDSAFTLLSNQDGEWDEFDHEWEENKLYVTLQSECYLSVQLIYIIDQFKKINERLKEGDVSCS